MIGKYGPRSRIYTVHDRHVLSKYTYEILNAEPHTSVGSVADLRTGGRWFDPRLGQYPVRRLTIVTATGVIPLSPLSVISTMNMCESSNWLGKDIVRCTGRRGITERLKDGVKHHTINQSIIEILNTWFLFYYGLKSFIYFTCHTSSSFNDRGEEESF